MSTPTSPPTTEIQPTTTPLPTASSIERERESERSPTETSVPVILTPPVNFDDLTPYRQAMVPAFTDDVDDVATEGVSRYYIEATLNFEAVTDDTDLTLTGTERVRYTNNETVPLDEIYFRLYPNLPGYDGQMTIDTVVVDDQPVTPTLEANDSALRVPLSSSLEPGEVIDVTVFFNATVPTQSRRGYNIFSFTNGTAALAGFYPAVAVYDHTGWNIEIPPPYGDATYLDIALFQVNLTVPQDMTVATSGSLLDTQANGDGTKTLALASGPMRDFYVAMSENFQKISQVVDGITINSYYPSGLAEGGEQALNYAVDSFRLFHENFGSYPYAEFDVIATPTTAGGVEYPGIVVVSENLYNQQGGFFEHATVHEVAHQWWYGLVGNDQVDDPWLDESLTNYSTIFYWEKVHGDEVAAMIIDGFFFGPYEAARAGGGDRAVTDPVSEYTAGEYGAFVYGKGPLFFNALRQEVGDEVYFDIMQSYFNQYKYKNATPRDLFNTIEQVSGQNVEPLLESWLKAR